MKNLKLLGLIVCILLIFLIFISINSGTIKNDSGLNNNQVDLQKENVEEVVNNGGSVLRYNGYLYYIITTYTEKDGFNNKICRESIEDKKIEVLYDAEKYRLSDRLIIFNNNLFFSMVGQTYYINLENKNYISKYNVGTLYSIGDGKLIYAYDNNLFKATYYPKTLVINSISTIATLDSNFMFEDDKNLYFYSNNSDNSKSIVSVNKQNQTVKVLDRIYQNENNIVDILNYKLSEKYIYLILQNGDYEIRRISKDGLKVEFVNTKSKPTEIIYTLNNNLYYKLNNYSTLYEYNEKENKILEVETPRNAPDIYYINLNGKNISLYKNEEELATIVRDVDKNLQNVSIEEINDNLYIRFETNGEEMFWRVKNDGNNLERLNNN